MAILSRVASTAALAVVALVSLADPSQALATPSVELGHVAARHAFSPAHHGPAKNRKRNSHQNRKRCVARPQGPEPSPQTPPPANNGGNTPNNNGNNGGNNGGNNNPAPPPPSNNNPPSHNGGGYSGRGKLGLAWPNGDVPEFRNFATGKVGYYYTWSPWSVSNQYTQGVKHAPMLWGWHQLGDFKRLVQPGYADVVLGPNEVDHHEQANMNIWDGARIWNENIGPLRYQGYRLGSPATTSAPAGLQWIKDWLPLVNEKPDFLCVHWYDVGFDNFKAYVTKFHEQTGGYNIWITEYACQNFNGGAQCSDDEVWNFHRQATEWVNATPWIETHFPFGVQRDMVNVNYANRLMNDDGSPSALGAWYIY